MSFVVATWNVWWQFGPWEERQPAISATLDALDADVVMLQETWRGQAEQLAVNFGYEVTWAGRDPHGNTDRNMGNAILSRWPILTTAHLSLADAEGRQYRTIVHAGVDTPWGVLPAFTTHLEYRFDQSQIRIDQLKTASEFIEEHATGSLPPVLTGDLNAVPDSDEIRKLTGRTAPYVSGRVWTDAWEQVGVGAGITWSKANPYIEDSAWPNRRLDYVFVGWPRDDRPTGNPVRSWLFGVDPVDGIVPSDHYGVAVEIHS